MHGAVCQVIFVSLKRAWTYACTLQMSRRADGDPVARPGATVCERCHKSAFVGRARACVGYPTHSVARDRRLLHYHAVVHAGWVHMTHDEIHRANRGKLSRSCNTCYNPAQ